MVSYLHGVIDGHSSCDDSPRAVDVDVDGLLVRLRLQKQQLGDHDARDVVFNLFNDWWIVMQSVQ